MESQVYFYWWKEKNKIIEISFIGVIIHLPEKNNIQYEISVTLNIIHRSWRVYSNVPIYIYIFLLSSFISKNILKIYQIWWIQICKLLLNTVNDIEKSVEINLEHLTFNRIVQSTTLTQLRQHIIYIGMELGAGARSSCRKYPAKQPTQKLTVMTWRISNI